MRAFAFQMRQRQRRQRTRGVERRRMLISGRRLLDAPRAAQQMAENHLGRE